MCKEHSLLFIPDITGFSSFVSKTEIGHSQLIIAELLELIIDSDRLGMTVAEVEGDAVLFYKENDKTTAEEIISQARETFYRFNQHLKLYEHQRICTCKACKSAKDLSIKFVAHRGEIEIMQVKDHSKPYGAVVVEAHKLLKNKHDFKEYILITDRIPVTEKDLCDKAEIAGSFNSHFPNVGTLEYAIVDLSAVHDSIPIPKIPQSPQLSSISAEHSVTVHETIDVVMDLFFDLSERSQWVPGLKAVEYDKNRVARIGTTYHYRFEMHSEEVQVLPKFEHKSHTLFSEKYMHDTDRSETLMMYYFDESQGSTIIKATGHILSVNQTHLPRNVDDVLVQLQKRVTGSVEGLKGYLEASVTKNAS